MALHDTPDGPLALVQRWNARTVQVRCPYCTKIHNHGFSGNYFNNQRVPHCGNKSIIHYPSYIFRYPFSATDNTTAYEIDKISGFYVSLDAETPKSAEDALDKAFTDLSLSPE